MKLFFLLLVSTIAFTADGQDKKIYKRKIYKSFKASIDQENEGWISTLSNPWITSNEDSLYFKSDTLNFINTHTRYPETKFCFTINWSFYKKNKFFRSHSENCLARVYAGPPEFELLIVRKKKNTFIHTWNVTTGILIPSDTFKVIRFQDDGVVSTMTLLRLK